MPPKIQLAQEKGFAIYMLKALFNGYGDELVEVAKTNLLRLIGALSLPEVLNLC